VAKRHQRASTTRQTEAPAYRHCPRIKIRNPKSETNAKHEAPNQKQSCAQSGFGISEFGFVSSFDIRASSLGQSTCFIRSRLRLSPIFLGVWWPPPGYGTFIPMVRAFRLHPFMPGRAEKPLDEIMHRHYGNKLRPAWKLRVW
jgi:hypothetical protein